MKTKIYVIYNKMACELNPKTFNAPNDDVAKNIIENTLYNQDGTVAHEQIRNAKHYTLVCLGEYDTECGITGLGGDYRTVCEVEELIKTEENSPKTE